MYRYREGAQNETSDQREHRLGVRRNAKQRAYDKFDAEKVAKKRAKRSKRTAAAAVLPAPAAAVSPAAVPAFGTPQAGVLGWGGALPAFGTPELLLPRDIATERDLAILRAFRQEASPAAVLDRLQSSGLDDDEPWTEQRVLERHDFLRRSVRTTARLVGPAVVLAACMNWWPCACECEPYGSRVLCDSAPMSTSMSTWQSTFYVGIC